MKPSVIILAYNSFDTLGATLAQAQEISDDLHVVDSFSTDDTVALTGSMGPRSSSMPSKIMARNATGQSTTWFPDTHGNCTWTPMSGSPLN